MWSRLFVSGCLLALAACTPTPPEPGLGAPLAWAELPGWQADRQAEAWPALLQGCRVMPRKRPEEWAGVCAAAEALGPVDDAAARAFFEGWFVPHRFHGSGPEGKGLVTGYYEPLLHGSLAPDDRYRYPLYRRPEDLIRVELGDLFPELKGKKVRGRLVGQRLVPYFDRAEIDNGDAPLAGNELVWVDDPVDAFFLQVQGSGRVRLSDGSILAVGYADQNGHPYRSIGKVLIERGEIPREQISLFSIRDWLRRHPDQAWELLASNASYVFFQPRENAEEQARGSLNVPLTPGRSIAVDRNNIPLGTPVWLDTSYPGPEARPLQRLVLAQDTGGAIKGHARADLFWGDGEEAERLAGEMKQEGALYVLVPKTR
jgi:membrane-bound lytic murein transglycosylase A